jgi:hypothetical protein
VLLLICKVGDVQSKLRGGKAYTWVWRGGTGSAFGYAHKKVAELFSLVEWATATSAGLSIKQSETGPAGEAGSSSSSPLQRTSVTGQANAAYH